jgi:hypothetical protein
MHSTDNIDDDYFGSGYKIRRSIKKYGKNNHIKEIMEFLPDRKSLRQREKELVSETLLKDDFCMNLVVGGGGGFISIEGVKNGRKICDEILRKKHGDDFRRIIVKNYYENLSPEENEKRVEKIKIGQKNSNFDFGSTFRGKKHTEESKLKIGESNKIKQKGELNSQFGSCWITNGIENKKIKKTDTIPDNWKLGRVQNKRR